MRSRVLSGVFIGLAFVLGSAPMRDFDAWWHLRTGQLILERGAVPQADWFAYADPAPWIDLHWGFQVVLAALFSIGGAPLLVALKALLTSGALASCVAARRSAWPMELALVAWLPALLALSLRMVLRPELFTLLFLSVYLCVLFHAERRPRLLWLLPLVQLLWVNLQPLFPLGPIVLALYLVGRLLDDRFAPTPSAAPRWRLLAGVALAVCGACLVNPYGARGLLLPLDLLRWLDAPLRGDAIVELEGIGSWIAQRGVGAFRDPHLLAMTAAFALALTSFLAAGGYRRGIAFRLALFSVFSLLGWQALRNVGLFAVSAGFVTAWNLGDGWELRATQRRSAGSDAPTRGFAATIRAALLVLVLVLAGLAAVGRSLPWSDGFGYREERAWYAHEACRFLNRAGMPRHVFAAHLGQAAVCLYHLAPERFVFADPRFVAPLQRFQVYRAALQGMAEGSHAWETSVGAALGEAFEPADLAVVLDHRVAAPAVVGLLGDPHWRPVLSDEVATLFLRVDKAEALGLPAVEAGAYLSRVAR